MVSIMLYYVWDIDKHLFPSTEMVHLRSLVIVYKRVRNIAGNSFDPVMYCKSTQ